MELIYCLLKIKIKLKKKDYISFHFLNICIKILVFLLNILHIIRRNEERKRKRKKRIIQFN